MSQKRFHPTIVLFGLSSLLSGCRSLSVDLPTHARHHRRQLHQPVIRHRALKLSNDSDNEQSKDADFSASFGGRVRRQFPALRTAISAFCAGSVLTLTAVLSMHHSALSNDQAAQYQTADVARSTISTKYQLDKNAPVLDATAQKRKSVALYRSILEELDSRYVDNIEPMTLFETSTRAMLSTLDPYTEYVSPNDLLKRQKLVGIGAFVIKAGDTPEQLDGKSVSTILSLVPSAVALPTHLLPGLDVNENDNGFRVVLSLEGYAYDAGLRVGDEILEIDNRSIAGEKLEKVRELLVGAPGTTVKLAFKRSGVDKVQTIDIERKVVQFQNVPYAGVLRHDGSNLSIKTASSADGGDGDGIGYIKLRRFGLDAGISMKRAIQDIQSDGMKGLILDLRDNSGGELLSAVQIASLFFPEDTYLGSSNGKGSLYPNESYRAGKLALSQYGYASSDASKFRNASPPGDNGDIFLDGKQMINPDKTPIIILTNKRTASASEFLAGAFQDLDKGVILGSDKSTLGKGIGQRELGLPNGGGALKLTYHEFYTPSGRCVQSKYQQGIKDRVPLNKEKQKENIFYTENGRTIHDRRGIEVDYKAEPKTSLLSSLLSSSGAYFEFSTEFWSKHRLTPSSNSDFVVDDQIYNDFKTFVLKEQKRGNLKLGEAYDNQHLLENIQRFSVETKLQDSNLIEQSVANLRENVVQDLLKDFGSCKEIIRSELEQNILAQQLPDSELMGRSLESDELVGEAVRILEDTDKYSGLLHPN